MEEATYTYDLPESKRRLIRNLLIPRGSILSVAPSSTQHHIRHYELLIGIGKDHHAKLIISEPALMALQNLEAEVTIF